MAALRVPSTTMHRLLTTTSRPLSSSPLPRLHLRPNQGIQTPFSSAFSTTRAVRNSTNPSATPTPNVNANGNPSYPSFSLKRVVPNPRVRAALYVAFVFMAAAEGYMWYVHQKYNPCFLFLVYPLRVGWVFVAWHLAAGSPRPTLHSP
jgi:hypothetical protein